MPQRKGPSERLQRAAAEAAGVELADEDEDALRFSIKPDAWAWEKWLGRFLRVRGAGWLFLLCAAFALRMLLPVHLSNSVCIHKLLL